MTVEELTNAVLQLTVKERAQLAGQLLKSLDDLSEDEVQELWVREAERRDAEMDRNPTIGRPGEEVLRAARDRLA